MLALPDSGMTRSVNHHNVKLEILCDWIEASILFDEYEDEISVIDVVDVLINENIYVEQDFAEEMVDRVWEELRRRVNCIHSQVPFSVSFSEVKRIDSWHDAPGHSFCVLLSLAQCYRRWWRSISSGNYNEQGELFELFTQESLNKQFADWHIRRTSWSRAQPSQFQEVVDQIAEWLGEDTGDSINKWTSSKKKDAGLDILCYRSFPDNRPGFPVYLMQCASGQHWDRKLCEPTIELWCKFVDFVVRPQKAFAIPFALADDEFKNNCILIQGLFLDRYRLLAARRYCERWESSALKDRIIRWAMPRIKELPRN